MTRPACLLAAVAVALLAGCSGGTQKPGPADGATLEFTPKASIVMDDATVSPDHVQARVGDTLTVTNHGTVDRGLTSRTIETGTLHPGESTTVFLTATGTVELHDRADPSHTTTIAVAPADG